MTKENQATQVITKFDIEGTQKKDEVRIEGNVNNQFGIKGLWVKGNLHCHSDRPGNSEWLADVINHYHQLGYDFIAGMDHDKIVNLEPLPDLIVVPGAEVSCGGHLLAMGIKEIPEGEKAEERTDSIAEMIKKVKQIGGITILAHPFKSAYSWQELTKLCEAGLDGLELVNSNVRGKGADSGRADQLWHNLLREGWPLTAFGNDDAHGPHEDMTDSKWAGISHIAWTGMLVEEFSQEAILDAMHQQRTYASEGPEITNISFQSDGKLVVECSPCVACHFRSVGGHYGGASVFPSEEEATSQSFVFDFASQGYRIEDELVIVLQDRYGRRAWTSPIKVDLTLTKI